MADPGAAVAPTSETSARTLPPGKFQVEFVDGRVTLSSNAASNVSVLNRLGELAGFEVVAGRLQPRKLILDVRDASIEGAIDALMTPRPYGADYEFDAATGARVLTRLHIGEFADVAAASAARTPKLALPPGITKHRADKMHKPPKSAGKEAMLAHRRRKQLAQEERERLATPLEHETILAERARRAADADAWDASQESQQAALLRDLRDGDPAVRSDALVELSIDRVGVEPVAALLKSDPDPRVRSAAAERLADEGGYEATAALIAGLSDPESIVVLEAIDGLAFLGDPSTLRYIEPLTKHANREVADAADEAISRLE
ncbi:MAG: HEAT repeat domain-containing protein [Myxococcota bacterium]